MKFKQRAFKIKKENSEEELIKDVKTSNTDDKEKIDTKELNEQQTNPVDLKEDVEDKENYNDSFIRESFADDIYNYNSTVDISRNTRSIVVSIYKLRYKINILALNDNVKTVYGEMTDLTNELVRTSDELRKIKKYSNPELRKAIERLEQYAEKSYQKEVNEYITKKNNEERVEEGVALADISGNYFTEMNHFRGIMNDLITVPIMMRKHKLLSMSYNDVINMIPTAKKDISKYEDMMRDTYSLFDQLYKKIKDTHITEENKFDDYVEIHPELGVKRNDALQLFNNKVMYIRSDVYLMFECKGDDEKSNKSLFSSILKIAKKLTKQMQEYNHNSNVTIKIDSKYDKKHNIKYIVIAGYIKKIIGTAADGNEKGKLFGKREFIINKKDNNDDIKKEADDNIEEMSPEMKRLDIKRGKLADYERELKKAVEKYKETNEERFNKQIQGYSNKIEKLQKELEEDEKQYKKELEKMKQEATITEAREMEDEIKPIVETLNKKGYKVKYASPGHKNLRKKEDKEPDGVYYNKLYSDARIMFDDKYKFPEAPKYWHWREVDGCSYLDITPKEYDNKDKTPDNAFNNWKNAYMNSLKNFVDNLPEKGDPITEDVNTFVDLMQRDIFESIGFDNDEEIKSDYIIELSELMN